jgi:hypothetical protein
MQQLHQYEKITFEQNNRSWAGGDAVIYRSWRVVTMRYHHPPALWPRELIAAIVGVTIVEEVVTSTDEMT